VSSGQARRVRTSWLPGAAGAATAAVGAINVASALTPAFRGRLALLHSLLPSGLVLTAHALVLPAGVGLLGLSVYLARRRRRALLLAVALLAAVGALELAKGLDVAEAAISWALAGALWLGRRAFVVRHDRATVAVALRRVAVLAVAVVAATAATVALATHATVPALTIGALARETLALLSFAQGPLALGAHFDWLPLGVASMSAATIATGAWTLFRPLGLPRQPATAGLQRRVRRLVQQHGSDTLSAFKLRADVRTFVARDGRAFCAYRVERGVLLVSGDPVGPADALPALMAQLCAFATERGLRVGAVGASAAFASLASGAGLRALYMGDEALVATGGFTLDGHAVKKVRQAVNRVERLGYHAALHQVADLSPAALDELDAVSERWREGAPERGFSMAMEGLRGAHVRDSVVVVARDAAGAARGFLHFVPAYGRPAMSLSAMRRDRDTPNGLTEFLVVASIRQLGALGVEELSLNFAAFARWLHSPSGRLERCLAAILRRADRCFQIESLFRFNVKFGPRWQSRYLLHEGWASLPRTALAALWVEGQIPRPALPSRLVAQRAGSGAR
jgi:lysyl-tRNA synthetase, class II